MVRIRYRSNRLDSATIAATKTAIPNRLAYFDALSFDSSASIPGDINYDGHVGTADYVMWRNNPYRTQSQYDLWRAHFGQSAGNGSGNTVSPAVPQPATRLLLMIASVSWCLRRDRRA